MKITPTELRSNIYKIIDQVIATGEPCEIVRNGETVMLSKPGGSKKTAKKRKPRVINDLSKLAKMEPLGCMTEDPDWYIHIEWDDWHPYSDI